MGFNFGGYAPPHPLSLRSTLFLNQWNVGSKTFLVFNKYLVQQYFDFKILFVLNQKKCRFMNKRQTFVSKLYMDTCYLLNVVPQISFEILVRIGSVISGFIEVGQILPGHFDHRPCENVNSTTP